VISGDAQPEVFEAIGQEAGEGDGGHDMSGDETPAPGGEQLTIVAGAGDFQDADAPDEFADSESPADYSVNVLRIKPGTTVTWTNEDAMLHTVTAADGSFDSGFLEEGDTWSYTFEDIGEFEYFCLPHPWMKAKVIVEE
jgi:plastocyanin